MGSAWQANRSSGESRLGLFALEIALITAIYWADSAGYIPLSKTPFLILVAWFSIRIRGLKWRDLGLRFGAGWQQLAGIGVLAGIAFWLFEYFVENPVLHWATGKYPDLTNLKAVVGNIQVLLLLGVLYMRTGFNLVAPIVAHIVANTCDFLLMFAGHHVGLTGRFPFQVY